MIPFRSLAAIVAVCVALAGGGASAARAPDATLRGVMTAADHQTYREVPFHVPAGTTRLTVEFEHTGKDQKSVIDLGLRDPQRFRGWSGGNKTRFTVSEAEATASYLPGPLPSGEWKLVLGVPNLREGAQAEYTARVYFERGAAFGGFQSTAVKPGPAWFRGDLHVHTAHSDGACASRKGHRVPCPVFRTLEAAAARGLDFISVTDHNATSQNQALRELAPYFDDLLLLPGREVTTFQGHANVFGPTGFLDFQLGSPRAQDLTTLQGQVEKAGGLISINHPGLPSGELCMGCGWVAKPTDFARIQAIEVVNGGSLAFPGGAESAVSGIPFWEARLNAGHRITAVGGSDNHDTGLSPTKPGAIGYPTTVVHAADLSQVSILEGLRRGHVFIDVEGEGERLLEVTATLGDQTAQMGDQLLAQAGDAVLLQVHVSGVAGGVVELRGDGASLAAVRRLDITSQDQTLSFQIKADGAAHWLRVDVRGADGRLRLLGNPVYLVPPR
ncbi:MAG: CehA/McbA family metallohydrolase [Phenylobacterium sp.]|uniref:CehA/McbA family metallohydrolase n=1 Tax=Phenylobacterium sp. TaxID=1871053 RepID=UPI00271AF874|nr:CehA/McbA family metallohydrolase [Phenylobacterium sp.]MDO8913667.1 CehA/McbA family metallohydrolase [Phenylobacterium sp.]MDP3099033.1 CehA/McbA family metallohydrolase [Phenylobacterium sp.]